jgi:putative transposase
MSKPTEREKLRNKIYTSNVIERVNKEVKRRSDIAMIFPNQQSALNLCGAVLMDISLDWQVSDKIYLNMLRFI